MLTASLLLLATGLLHAGQTGSSFVVSVALLPAGAGTGCAVSTSNVAVNINCGNGSPATPATPAAPGPSAPAAPEPPASTDPVNSGTPPANPVPGSNAPPPVAISPGSGDPATPPPGGGIIWPEASSIVPTVLEARWPAGHATVLDGTLFAGLKPQASTAFGEFSSRTIIVGGLEVLEMTVSW